MASRACVGQCALGASRHPGCGARHDRPRRLGGATVLNEQVRLDTTFGFLDAATASDQIFHPLLVSNQDRNTMLRAIRAELRRATSFTFSVAFVTPHALAMLKQALLDFRGRGRIITSTYLGFNSPAAFRELLNLPRVD